MRVLVAYDRFKDSMTAEEACESTASALSKLHPDWSLDLAALTDGGDGFGMILTASAKGQSKPVKADGPFLEPEEALMGMVEIDRLPVAARTLLVGLPDANLHAISPADLPLVEALRYERTNLDKAVRDVLGRG